MMKSSNASPERAARAWWSTRARHVLVAALCLVCLSACEQKKPEAVTKASEPVVEQPSEAQVQWEALQVKLADASLSHAKRLGLIQAFERKHRKTPYARQARALAESVNAGRKVSRVSNRAGSYVHRGVRRAWGQSSATMAPSASPEVLRDIIVFNVLRDAYQPSKKRDASFKPVTLSGVSGATRTVEKPVLLGIGVVRLNFMNAIAVALPSFKVQGCIGFGGRDCYQQTVNAIANVVVGKPLYKGPAQLDAKVIEPMLKSLALADKGARVLGAPTSDVYQAYRPTLLALAHTHKILSDKKHAPGVLRAYKALLKTHAALEKKGAYHKALLRFYKEVVQDKGLVKEVGESPRVMKVYAGFWIRRMGDGSADAFANALKQIITTHDPAHASTLYKQ